MREKDLFRIIICEDNSKIRSEIRRSVTELGHEVVAEVSTEKDIVKSVCSKKPDVVLLSFKMSGMNSYNITQHVQQTCPTPVIILSEDESDELQEKARSYGASFFAIKSTDTSEIDRAISIAVARHRDLLELQQMHDREKILIRESSHRVKNNLAIITSIMYLQADCCENTETADAILDCVNRVRVIAAMHEVIHSSGNAEIVRLDHFLELIVSKLRQSITEDNILSLEVTVDKILMDRENAINCGLIINELITNAIKHAFPGQERKRDVSLMSKMLPESDIVELSVYDNGSGLPGEINPKSAKSFGFQLVCALVDQLRGELEVVRSQGTKFNIRFKAPSLNV